MYLCVIRILCSFLCCSLQNKNIEWPHSTYSRKREIPHSILKFLFRILTMFYILFFSNTDPCGQWRTNRMNVISFVVWTASVNLHFRPIRLFSCVVDCWLFMRVLLEQYTKLFRTRGGEGNERLRHSKNINWPQDFNRDFYLAFRPYSRWLLLAKTPCLI